MKLLIIPFPRVNIKYFLLILGLGFICCFPLGANALELEIDNIIAITEPLHLSQIYTHYPIIRVSNAPIMTPLSIEIDSNKIEEITSENSSFFYKLEKPLTSGIHYLNIRTSPNRITRTILFEVLPYPTVPQISLPFEGAVVNTSQPVIEGIAEDGSLVQIYLNDVYYASITTLNDIDIGSSGSLFVYKISPPLSDGSYALKVRIIDKYNTVSAFSKTLNFEVKNIPPSTPAPVEILGQDIEIKEEGETTPVVISEEEEAKETEDEARGEEAYTEEETYIEEQVLDEEEEPQESEKIFINSNRRFLLAALVVLLFIGGWWLWQRRIRRHSNKEPPASNSDQKSFWS